MNTKFSFCRAVLVFSMCALSSVPEVLARADSPVPTPPYTLTRKYVAGTVSKYAMTLDMIEQLPGMGQAPPVNVHMDMTDTVLVQSVRPSDGAGTLLINLAVLDGLANGQPMPLAVVQKNVPSELIETISPQGKVLSVSSAPGQPPLQGISSLSTAGAVALLPGKPVNIGDVWSTTTPMSALSVNLNMATSLVSVQKINGSSVATLDTKVIAVPALDAPPPTPVASAPGMSPTTTKVGQMTGETWTRFDMGTGEMTKMSSSMDLTMMSTVAVQNNPMSMQIHMNMKTTMTMLPPT